MDGKTILQKLVQQFFVIYTLSMAAAAAYCKLFYPQDTFTLDYLIGFMVQALIADLPLLVFYSRRELTQKQWRIRYILHFLLLESVLVGIGVYNVYFANSWQMLWFIVIVGVTYVLVRVSCYVLDRKTASELNARLQARQQERQPAQDIAKRGKHR